MRSVNIAELKNHVGKYLRFAKDGEEIIILDRNRPVAKLVPLSIEEVDEEELRLVAAGKMRLPSQQLKVDELLQIPTGKVASKAAIRHLLEERDESL